MRVRVVGRLNLLPEDVRSVIREVENATSNYSSYYLIFLIGYSGRAEIIDAVNALMRDKSNGIKEIDEELFRRYLYLPNVPDPDLVIRTSGEMRISNFLLWYIAYSELYFVKKYWPEITYSDLLLAIKHYQNRERRFGR